MNQSPSGRLLVMEPDYLPIPEIFVLAMFVPQEDFIPHEDYTPFHDEGCRGTSSPHGGLEDGPSPRLWGPGASGPPVAVWG